MSTKTRDSECVHTVLSSTKIQHTVQVESRAEIQVVRFVVPVDRDIQCEYMITTARVARTVVEKSFSATLQRFTDSVVASAFASVAER